MCLQEDCQTTFTDGSSSRHQEAERRFLAEIAVEGAELRRLREQHASSSTDFASDGDDKSTAKLSIQGE